jgi:hypothetical protein
VVFANGKTWAVLTPAQRRILTQAVTADLAAQTKFVRGGERTDTAILCRRGRLRFPDASPAGLAALRRAVQPVYAQLERDPQTRRYIRQIQAMRQGLPAEAAPGCAPATRPTGTAGTLDGVYRFTDTAAQLRAAPGTTPGEMMPENYGTWTLVLDRGHFATTQEDSQACTWGYGTFKIKGNKIEWLFTDGGSPTPDNAHQQARRGFPLRVEPVPRRADAVPGQGRHIAVELQGQALGKGRHHPLGAVPEQALPPTGGCVAALTRRRVTPAGVLTAGS